MTAFTATYATSDVAPAIIDFLVAILAGLVENGLLIGSAVAISLVIGLYTGIIQRFVGFLGTFIKSTRKMR